MSISANGALVHLPFTSRVDYSTPYPEGLAVGHIDVTGDASGGNVAAIFQADGLFLYRLELVQSTRGGSGTGDQNIVTNHRMLTDRSGRGTAAFDLNWHLTRITRSGFSTFTVDGADYAQLKRVPFGRTDNVSLQTVLTFFDLVNLDLILYDFDCIFSYWPVQALTRPGFLQAFWEAPVVSVGPA